MQLTRQQVMTWAPSDVLEAGLKLLKEDAVQGMQAQGEILGGSLRQGASRLVVRLRLAAGSARPQVMCPCAEGRSGKVCAHAVALGLKWAKEHGTGGEDSLTFSAERAPTREEIVRWAGPSLVARAEGLIRQGALAQVRFAYPTGSGRVRIHGGELAVTFRMLSNGLAEGKCPCAQSRQEGMLCEHIVALMLGVMQAYGNAERRAIYAQERARAASLARAQGLIARAANGRPASLLILLPRDLPKQFWAGTVKVAIRVSLNGKALRPQDLPPGPYAFSPADENLLGILEDIAGGPFPDILTLSARDAMAILRCSAQSWVGSAETRRRLVFSTEPVATPLLLEADPERDAVTLRLLCPEGGACLAEGCNGFWVTPTALRPLAKGLLPPFHSLYRQAETIPRHKLMGFFHTEWPLLTAQLPVAEGSLTPDLFTTTPGTPRFRLELSGSTASISATARARYGNTWVPLKAPGEVSVPDPDDFYHCTVRNPPAEREALERLHAIGFFGGDGLSLGGLTGQRAVLNLLGSQVTALRREGWKVALSGPIADFFDAAEVIVPVVDVREVAGAGSDFEVSTRYASPRGTIEVTPAEIERALAHGNAYIEKEGKTALLDIGAIRTLRQTLNSCNARAGIRPGSSRIDHVHAPFVQSALDKLEGIDVEAAPDWRARAAAQNRERALEPIPLGRLENTLRPYQKQGVYWLRFLEICGFCGILADEMGLGKTLQTLTWLQLPRYREEAKDLPALIVCPTSLVENWHREAEKFAPWLRVLVLSGPDRAKRFAEIPRADLLITSYALIRRDIAFYTQSRLSAVVLDEAQAIKNQRTQNAQAVKLLRADTRLVLSGTPIENGVSDLWSIMDFLMPRYLGPYEDFKATYEDAIALGGATAAAAQERLRDKLHPFLLRRVKKEVAKDLPDKIRSVTYCELTPDQRRLYDTCRDDMRTKMRGLVKEKGFEKSKFEVLALLMRLRQICCDLRLLKDRTPRPNEAPSAKIDALMECLEEARAGGHRILVFSQFTAMLALIAQRLEAEAIPYCYLDGSTKDRLGECARFNQTPAIPLFLISLKAGGTGLNLTGADTVIHFDPWWNPAAEEQATDRAHRIGQKKTVHAIKFIALDTVEEKVLELQRKKQALIDATVNASDASILSSLTLADIEGLLK